jgi:hypothetical protein
MEVRRIEKTGGTALAVGEKAARKRLSRALDKLHGYFARRGISSTTTLLAVASSGHAVQAAPAALAKSVTLLAVAKGTATSTSTGRGQTAETANRSDAGSRKHYGGQMMQPLSGLWTSEASVPG